MHLPRIGTCTLHAQHVAIRQEFLGLFVKMKPPHWNQEDYRKDPRKCSTKRTQLSCCVGKVAVVGELFWFTQHGMNEVAYATKTFFIHIYRILDMG